jgi:hypothetical protein
VEIEKIIHFVFTRTHTNTQSFISLTLHFFLFLLLSFSLSLIHRSLKEVAEKALAENARLKEELRNKESEYQNTKQQLNAQIAVLNEQVSFRS